MLKKRDSLTIFDIEAKSNLIMNKIICSEHFKSCQWVFTYINMGSEVITENIILEAFKLGKKVAVPIAKKEHEMFFVEIKSLDGLKKSDFGVLEPETEISQQVMPDCKSFFIVPGTVFDKNLNRCGYGAGFYDKYFEKNNGFKKVAVSFDFQVIENLPTDIFDKNVDIIVTEKRIVGGNLI